ncbi:MAG: HU family DNA-binding protein [Desulfobacteraceae bacterium]|jgi:integration host factor subunit beta
MNKMQLIEALAEQNGMSKFQAKKVVALFFDAMANAMTGQERVEIRGLCTFQVRSYLGYVGRNPKTGDPIAVDEKRLPYFKPASDLKRRVDH